MSWIELQVNVDCPHCGAANIEHAEFNTLSGDQSGIDSGVYEGRCSNFECDEIFFYKARVDFELDADSFKKKPRVKNGKR